MKKKREREKVEVKREKRSAAKEKKKRKDNRKGRTMGSDTYRAKKLFIWSRAVLLSATKLTNH